MHRSQMEFCQTLPSGLARHHGPNGVNRGSGERCHPPLIGPSRIMTYGNGLDLVNGEKLLSCGKIYYFILGHMGPGGG